VLFAILAVAAATVVALVWGEASGHATVALVAWCVLAASALGANGRMVVRAITRPRRSES
jgi:hypothetical protein